MAPKKQKRVSFEQLVEHALAELPEELARALDNLEITVQDAPDDWMLQETEQDEDELLGLYVGVPLPERSYDAEPYLPDRIYIFQRPLERMFRDPNELREQIRITVIHELAHYFGFDEDYLRENGWA